MTIDIYGHSDPHLHGPCPVCGYATRYKQWSACCTCTTPDRCPHPPIYVRGNNICQRCGGDPRVPRESTYGKEWIQEIWAEQEQKNAALGRRVPTNVPPLRIADRYVAGRNHG
jgi:hypothetical protein